MAKKEPVQLPINGFSVDFPCKPYPTQVAMMAKILKAIDRHENALLESPTGSGKSLALLCSTLSWQRKAAESVLEAKQDVLQASECNCSCHVTGESVPPLPALGKQYTPMLTTPGSPLRPTPIMLTSLPGSPQVAGSLSSLAGVHVPGQVPIQPIQMSHLLINGGPVVAALPAGGVAPVLAVQTAGVATPVGALTTAPVVGDATGQMVMAGPTQATPGAAASSAVTTASSSGSYPSSLAGVAGKRQGNRNEDDDADFKPQSKRLRGATPSYRKGRHHRGIKYEGEDEDVTEGGACSTPTPSWSCQLKSGVSAPVTSLHGVEGGEIGSVHVAATPAKQFDPWKSRTIEVCGLCKCSILDQDAKKEQDKTLKQHVPTIFYGTRTHKQITQIVHELRKTAFAGVRMTILASRDHYCVHPDVSKLPNRRDQCRDHIKVGACNFYKNVQKVNTHDRIAMLGLDAAWDIEDLITASTRRKVSACPYFGARELAKNAQIIFCPYNYLVDPRIREQLDIELAGNIVVLDEAHNIEDSARDAASFSFTTEDLEKAQVNLAKLVEKSILPEHHRPLEAMLSSIMAWYMSVEGTLKASEFDKLTRTWLGTEMVKELDTKCSLNERTVALYNAHFDEAVLHAKEQEQLIRDADSFGMIDEEALLGPTSALLQGLFMILAYLLKNRAHHAVDYRIGVVRTRSRGRPVISNDGWRRRPNRNDPESWTDTIHFWCMNPAVCFKDLDEKARTIVLTSGTLAPIESFSSELGVPFRIAMEGNHVVPRAQVWVQTLAAGPRDVALNASYKHTETLEFQDELGRVIKQVCETVPFGVLCFMPSYSMMDKLVKRWRMTGLYNDISRRKVIVLEPRHGRDEFEASLHEFYGAINAAAANGGRYGTQTGGLLFAVCRGKVSEGLDFTDNNARAVITIGIPFPNFKDKLVELKRAYNNQQVSRGLLNGSEWYEIQAFRALNQALGRCIRHKGDWGALILIDERFRKSQERYVKGLSKWVRGSIIHADSCSDAMESLHEFTQHRLACAAEAAKAADLEADKSQLFSPSPSCSSVPASPALPACKPTAHAASPMMMLGGVPMARPPPAQHRPAFSHTGLNAPVPFNPPAALKPSAMSITTPVARASLPVMPTMLTPYDAEKDACVRLKVNPVVSSEVKAIPAPVSPRSTTPLVPDHAYTVKCTRFVSPPCLPQATVQASTGIHESSPVIYGGLKANSPCHTASRGPIVPSESDESDLECTLPYFPVSNTAELESKQDISTPDVTDDCPGSPSLLRSLPTVSSSSSTAIPSVADYERLPLCPCDSNEVKGDNGRQGATHSGNAQGKVDAPSALSTKAGNASSSDTGLVVYESRPLSQSSEEKENEMPLVKSVSVAKDLPTTASAIAPSHCAATRSDTIQDEDSDDDIIEGSPQAGELPSSIPESPTTFDARDDSFDYEDTMPMEAILQGVAKAMEELPQSGVLAGGAAPNPKVTESAHTRRGHAVAEPSVTSEVSQQQQQEEDDMMVELVDMVVASQSPVKPPPPATSSHRRPIVYGGLKTKRRNTRLCPPRQAPEDVKTSGEPSDASTALEAPGLSRIATNCHAQPVNIKCRRCNSQLAVTLSSDEHDHDEKALQIPPVFRNWLQAQSPVSLTCAPKSNTRQASRGSRMLDSSLAILLGKALPEEDAGGGGLKSWFNPGASSASMDCMLADELNSILQPLICSQCASLAAAEAAGKPKRRSSRRAPAHEEQPEENQSPPTVVGMRRVPLQSSDTTQKELWLLSTCCLADNA